jgi:hypothetical protein
VEDLPLISAERFAKERSSYWSQLLPRLDGYVRAINLGVGRFSPPIASEIEPHRHAFIAELAFELFKFTVTSKREVLAQEEVDTAITRTRERMAALEDISGSDVHPPNSQEREEAVKIVRNLHEFLLEREPTRAVVSPQLPGCGFIDRASADLILYRPLYQPASPFKRDMKAEDEILLYEIKTVQRPFRASDIRQLLTYGALLAATGNAPANLGIVNPRLGTFFEASTNAITLDTGGLAADELFQQIIFDVSAAETSL